MPHDAGNAKVPFTTECSHFATAGLAGCARPQQLVRQFATALRPIHTPPETIIDCLGMFEIVIGGRETKAAVGVELRMRFEDQRTNSPVAWNCQGSAR